MTAVTWYVRIVGGILLVQGLVTGTFLAVEPLRTALPAVLDVTRMVPLHSALHVVTGLLALAVLGWGGPRERWIYAAGFGLGYTALALSGLVSGHDHGLGLQPFDHPFHLLVGVPGLVVAAIGARTALGDPPVHPAGIRSAGAPRT